MSLDFLTGNTSSTRVLMYFGVFDILSPWTYPTEVLENKCQMSMHSIKTSKLRLRIKDRKLPIGAHWRTWKFIRLSTIPSLQLLSLPQSTHRDEKIVMFVFYKKNFLFLKVFGPLTIKEILIREKKDTFCKFKGQEKARVQIRVKTASRPNQNRPPPSYKTCYFNK